MKRLTPAWSEGETSMYEDKIDDVGAELLGSKGMIKVLSVISEHGELNISAVSCRTGLNHRSVDKHLRNLMRLGLVQEKRYGSIRIFEARFRALRVILQGGCPITIEVQ